MKKHEQNSRVQSKNAIFESTRKKLALSEYVREEEKNAKCDQFMLKTGIQFLLNKQEKP